MRVVKRNGQEVKFNSEKIINAIEKAMQETEIGVDNDLSRDIASNIQEDILEMNVMPTVNAIQDMVEEYLMDSDRKDVAKQYILYRSERDRIRDKGWEMTTLQRDILQNKYQQHGETFSEFIERVSGKNDVVAKAIRNKEFLFAGRTLAGRGQFEKTGRKVMLSNCAVLPPPEDSVESIFERAKQMAVIYSRGGGVGLDISTLRPNGSPVNNSAYTTTGAVSFIPLYDITTGVIGQNNRRGALMITMDVHYPDIMDFINCKNNIENVTNANISVRVDDEFMQHPNKEVFDTICRNAWSHGEPGFLYWDRIKSWHLLSEHPEYEIVSTNPCGEQPLPAYGVCNLASVNLSEFVRQPFTPNAYIDWDRLKVVVREGIVGLDSIIDETLPTLPLKEQQEQVFKFRQVGLGIMGLADLFIKMGITYGSDESLAVSDQLGRFILNEAITSSCDLADKFGTYPAYNYEYIKKSSFYQSLDTSIQKRIKQSGMRNSHVLSIAPTGTLSTLLNVSGGAEPIFANYYTRTTKSLAGEGDVDYTVVTAVIDDLMKAKGIKSLNYLPDYCVTSHDISPIDRIKVQSVWQKYIDSGISSTINLKEETTVEQVAEIYMEAWKHKLKGVTVFRDNCFRAGILKPKESPKNKCPDCGGILIQSNGCSECQDCGFSACSI